MSSADIEDWLSTKLNSLELDPEVYCGYVTGMMQDEEIEIQERVEGVVDMLSGATECSMDGFADELKLKWGDKSSEAKAAEAIAVAAQKEAYRKQVEDEHKRVAKAQEKKAEAAAKATLDEDAQRERNRLLDTYSFTESRYDEDGNMIADDEEGEDEAGQSAPLNNRSAGASIMKDIRAKSKADHEAQRAREKDLLIKDKERRDRSGKKTVKKERRPRG